MTKKTSSVNPIDDTYNTISNEPLPKLNHIPSTETLLFENDSWNDQILSPLSKLLRILLYHKSITKQNFIRKHTEYSSTKNYPKKTIDHERFNAMRNLVSPEITMKFFEKIVYQILGYNLEDIIIKLKDHKGKYITINLNPPFINEE
jgi:hypothetical protein